MNAEETRPLVLLADDDELFTDDVTGMLEGRFRVNTVHSGEQVLYSVVNDPPDVLLLDIEFEEDKMDGFAVLEALKTLEEPPPVIMLSRREDMIASAIRAVKLGAFHYIRKEPDPDELLHLIDMCLEENRKRRLLRVFAREAASRDSKFIAVDPLSLAVVDEIARIAPASASVLITGETGTGKEMAAKEIHRRSDRRDNLLVTMNCAAVPDGLIESELFGHVPGAFTDARKGREGLIATARGGTLFLDEIGDAPPSLQQKLLRVVEERTFKPVGADREQKADVRLITATRRDIEANVATGRFREDLYYRLNVLRLHLPLLRERPGDIMPLAEAMRERASLGKNGCAVIGFTDDAADWLVKQDWPGNAREVRNVVDRAVNRCRGEWCGLGDVVGWGRGQSPVPEDYHAAKEKALKGFQLAYVVGQLERHHGVIADAARAGGVTRQALSKMCQELGIDVEQYRRSGGNSGGESVASG